MAAATLGCRPPSATLEEPVEGATRNLAHAEDTLTIRAVIRRWAPALHLLAAGACLGGGAACVAPPPAPALAGGAGDEQAAVERGAPLVRDPNERALASLAGEWRVRREVLRDDGGSLTSTGGTARLEALLGGRLLRLSVRFERQGGPVEAEGLLAYDREGDRYQLVWASQAESGLRTASGPGRLDEAGIALASLDGSRTLLRLVDGRLVFESAPPGGGPALLRTVYEHRRPD
jgi:hypothetical protein